MTGFFQVLHVGATLVTQSSFEAGAALDLIEQERATIVTGWPQQGKTLRGAPAYTPERVAERRAHEHGRPRAARAATTGGQLDVAGHDRDVQRAPSWDQYDPLPESRRGTFGKTLPGISHKVVDPETLEEVPVGVDGELWAAGTR